MTGNVLFDLAESVVGEYAADSDVLMRSHQDAMECLECEEVLGKGIRAYELLKRAEDTFREADGRGLFDYTEELQNAVDRLYAAWLGPSAFAERWIERLEQVGQFPANRDLFRATCDEVRAIVEDRQWVSLTQAAFNEATAE
jgi:hypothetical protein